MIIPKNSHRWERMRELYLGSLWHFCYEILMFRDIDNDFHREELKKFDDNRRNGIHQTLTLWARNHLKSHLLTIGDTVREICRNDRVRVLIINETAGNAKNFLKTVSDNILENANLNHFFPEIRPSQNSRVKWTQEELTVERSEGRFIPEPTCKALGIDANIVSQHYDIIKYDDIVSWANTKTPEMIETLDNKFQFTISVLDPSGYQDVIGTRYDEYDLYSVLLKNKYYKSSVRQVKEINDKTGMEEFVFPQQFNQKRLDIIKSQQVDAFIFNCQYYNVTIKSGKRLFKKEDIKYYKSLPPGGYFRITIDPASSTKSYADKSAIVCAYWIGGREDYQYGAVFLDRYVHDHLDTDSLMEAMFSMYAEIRPEFMSVEIAGSQSGTLWDVICKEKDARGFSDAQLIKFTPPSQVSKYGRIAQMQPYFRRGQVYIKEEIHLEFEEQLTKYTGIKLKEKDDLIDAFSQQFQVSSFPPGMNDNDDEDDEWEDYNPLYGDRSVTQY